MKQAPNHKHQITNKSELPNSNDRNGRPCAVSSLLTFHHWCLFVIWFLVLSHSMLAAADGFPRVPPTPPEKAEATFEIQHDFRMELIAAEPLVASPVDLAYDEDG